MLAFADAKCYTTTHQQLLRDRSKIHVICCRIQFGDSSILMAMRAFCVVPGHRQIGESLWTSVTLPELKRSQLGMKVQHSWLNSILLKQWGSNAYVSSLLLGQSDGLQSSLPFIWSFILSSLLLGQSGGIQLILPLLWCFILSSLLLGQSEGIQSILPLLWCFILSSLLLGQSDDFQSGLPLLGGFTLSSLLLGQSDGIQASLPLCWGFMIYSLLLGQSEGIQASLCDLVGLILSANLLGHPVGISTSLPGFVGFYRIGYTDTNISKRRQLGPSKAIVHGSLSYLAVELLHTKRTC